MTVEEVQKNIWRNTLSNYVCVGLKVVLGVVMFRLLYQQLPREDLGFWYLLWSLFGYGILLDFGFGFTAQKRVAELSVHKHWEKLSRVLSTIFFSYVAVAAVLVAAGMLGSGWIIRVFEITPGNQERFQTVLTWFLCGLGIAFPMGLFPEVLRGQQRILLANMIFCVGMSVNFILAALALYLGWGLMALLVIALACTLVPDLVCGYFALRALPEVRIRPGLFSRGMVRETMSFSVYAYITTFTTLLLTKTDQLIISSALAVSAVAVYQAGAKVAEMFAGFSQQLPDTFSPAAAHLHARGDAGSLRRLLVDGTRFSVMLASPLYLVCAFYMEGFLRLLTGEAAPSRETFWVGQTLLLWCYITVATQSVSKRIFMMCGHERKLMFYGLGEALLNLGLSIALILYYRNVLAVAVGSLISSAVFGCFILWPWAAREAEVSPWALARTVLVPTWTACLPLLGLVVVQQAVPSFWVGESAIGLAAASSVAFVIAAFGLWHFALTDTDRAKLAGVAGKVFGRREA